MDIERIGFFIRVKPIWLFDDVGQEVARNIAQLVPVMLWGGFTSVKRPDFVLLRGPYLSCIAAR